MKSIAGLHLLIDGYVHDGNTLNPDTICTLFDKLVDVLGMTYLLRPIAMRVPIEPWKLKTGDDEGGWSVICQITTSHIALHGWPLRGAFMMDIFSCCDFNTAAAEMIVREALHTKEVNTQVIRRNDP